jgi:hypothetical protein
MCLTTARSFMSFRSLLFCRLKAFVYAITRLCSDSCVGPARTTSSDSSVDLSHSSQASSIASLSAARKISCQSSVDISHSSLAMPSARRHRDASSNSVSRLKAPCPLLSSSLRLMNPPISDFIASHPSSPFSDSLYTDAAEPERGWESRSPITKESSAEKESIDKIDCSQLCRKGLSLFDTLWWRSSRELLAGSWALAAEPPSLSGEKE